MSFPRNNSIILSRFYDTWRAWVSLFSFTTICPEVVERHHIFAYYGASPRTMFPQRREFLVPVHRALSSLGAVKSSGVFWVVEIKRDPMPPLDLHLEFSNSIFFDMILVACFIYYWIKKKRGMGCSLKTIFQKEFH